RFQGGLRYELQDAVVPLGIRHFQELVEKCQEIEDMRSKRVNRQGVSVLGDLAVRVIRVKIGEDNGLGLTIVLRTIKDPIVPRTKEPEGTNLERS
ncbi:gag polyprotein, partial [Trifolium medium]|nr:gag polyprotein [Trifolium medium]